MTSSSLPKWLSFISRFVATSKVDCWPREDEQTVFQTFPYQTCLLGCWVITHCCVTFLTNIVSCELLERFKGFVTPAGLYLTLVQNVHWKVDVWFESMMKSNSNSLMCFRSRLLFLDSFLSMHAFTYIRKDSLNFVGITLQNTSTPPQLS